MIQGALIGGLTKYITSTPKVLFAGIIKRGGRESRDHCGTARRLIRGGTAKVGRLIKKTERKALEQQRRRKGGEKRENQGECNMTKKDVPIASGTRTRKEGEQQSVRGGNGSLAGEEKRTALRRRPVGGARESTN